ncbi:di-heme oxidoredictase family protein [Terasakiella sp. SH-1]|uniref:di-heme oxidoredictase family protein n=1 Tax=Terasakiella sp. SH-1 TaxID=2560057 RepID=UPI001073F04B|nr:di-heme oxidoredictase family protein [Terasakiella sp. SH-1]
MKKVTAFFGLLLATSPAQATNLDFALGKALFDRPWTSAPASTQATDGLGPLFNARSCVACHPKAGRGKITVESNGEIGGVGYVLRLGSATGEGDPTYGRQLQTNAIHGQKAEGRVYLENGYYRIEDLAYGEMAEKTKYAGRLSQPLHGLGLLEEIPTEDILALADPDDKNGDGISGRAHMVNGQLGRFAWKATAPTLRIQAGNAFSNDIGMSSPIHRHHHGDCTKNQPDCLKGPHGDSVQFENLEIDTQMLDLVAYYLKRLPAPKSKATEPLPLFSQVGCADCHTPQLKTKSGQKVAAYSDLLLHDMGEGLADGIKENNATGREWRTQPLWGSANTKRFLHDGRAQTIEEAINWHGGEAAKAKANFTALSDTDKQRLINFINSL